MTAEIALRSEGAEQTMRDNAPAALVAWADAASAAHRLAAPLVMTDFVPAHFRPQDDTEDARRLAQAAATAAVLFGAEAGLTPMQALQGIYVISGRPAMYARTMLAVTLAQGHAVWTEDLTDSRAVVCGRRRGSQQVERVVWTYDRAKKAGYTRNAKYNTDPQSMLLARAQSDVCRRIAPDALLGMAYSVEELELEADEPAAETPKKRTAKRAPLAPVPEPDLDPASTPDPAEPASREQIVALNIQLQESGITDRAEKLAYLSGEVGRDITSSNELTRAEAHSLLDMLAAERTADQGDDTAPCPGGCGEPSSAHSAAACPASEPRDGGE